MKRLFLLAVALASLPACHDDTVIGVGREPDEYVGCATDELWSLFDVSDVVSDPSAPAFTAPAPGGTTLPAAPMDLTWKQTATIAGTAAGDVAMSCEQWNTGFATLHLPPISGVVYDLQIKVGAAVKHRVITTLQKWRASDAVWSSLKGQAVTLELRRITVQQNDRTEGPFIGSQAVTLTVASQ